MWNVKSQWWGIQLSRSSSQSFKKFRTLVTPSNFSRRTIKVWSLKERQSIALYVSLVNTVGTRGQSTSTSTTTFIQITNAVSWSQQTFLKYYIIINLSSLAACLTQLQFVSLYTKWNYMVFKSIKKLWIRNQIFTKRTWHIKFFYLFTLTISNFISTCA